MRLVADLEARELLILNAPDDEVFVVERENGVWAELADDRGYPAASDMLVRCLVSAMTGLLHGMRHFVPVVYDMLACITQLRSDVTCPFEIESVLVSIPSLQDDVVETLARIAHTPVVWTVDVYTVCFELYVVFLVLLHFGAVIPPFLEFLFCLR